MNIFRFQNARLEQITGWLTEMKKYKAPVLIFCNCNEIPGTVMVVSMRGVISNVLGTLSDFLSSLIILVTVTKFFGKTFFSGV